MSRRNSGLKKYSFLFLYLHIVLSEREIKKLNTHIVFVVVILETKKANKELILPEKPSSEEIRCYITHK